MIDILFGFVGEFLLQALFELLAELGIRSLEETVRRPRNPVLATAGSLLWGAIAGGLSLLTFPSSAIHDPVLRHVNLIATPIGVGLAMMLLGRRRLRNGQKLGRLDRFGYAFVFAFAMALVRYVWAQ